ncbi:BRO-N domain-containing protein [Halopseudomonas salina]|uniref:Bro-N domain-containing protein n=1 Tax=Halopseudomonas salina TaxID=1323744 RepID=A0ABQ1P1T6_9GAMM|nr:Bro-N domain-containing protein [Halopseudomonas salina]GGC89350.1 hypothetical protein GCM10007418_06320 [Halopseudomonas salina]
MTDTNLILSYPENGKNIRTIYRNEEVFFCLADVVQILAEQNTKLAADEKKQGLGGLTKALLDSLDPDEKYFVPEINLTHLQDSQFVSQPGLFRIILRDNSPACKKFQRWVFHDVLPSLQKFGTYPPPSVPQGSDVKKAVMLLLDEIEERERLERETRERFLVTERKLNELSERLSETESQPAYGIVYMSVERHSEGELRDARELQHIQGWCIKICAEEGYSSRKVIVDGKECITFPEIVLTKAKKQIAEI